MAYLNFYRFDEIILKFKLEKKRVTVGRGADNDICVPDQHISRLQFTIEPTKEGWHFVDQSKNGTKINGAITHECLLHNGDEVQLGKEWRFVFEPNPSFVALDHAPTIIEHRPPTRVLTFNPEKKELTTENPFLEISTPNEHKQTVPMAKDVLSIGTNRANDISLADDFVSNFHCKIFVRGNRFLLKDIGSTNGTTVDGRGIREVFLNNGSLITVGHTQIRFILKSQTDRIRKSKQKQIGRLLSSNERMLEIFDFIQKIAPSNATVCITGESGTGKEVVAETVHELSLRAHQPFIAINCAALKPELIESELFGHERGAFTSAVSARKGAFEAASTGTLFLDEIGELQPDLQPKLLRVIETGELNRVGSTTSIPVDVRLIVATNRNLAEDVKTGRFRADLFYRIHVLPIALPPLRERPEDLDDFVNLFSGFFSEQTGEELILDASAHEKLRTHTWPGNIRELRNLVHRLTLIANGSPITANQIQFDPSLDSQEQIGSRSSDDARKQMPPLETEREDILRALKQYRWNKTKTAEYLGMAKSTLYDKIQYYGFVSPLAPKKRREGIRKKKK